MNKYTTPGGRRAGIKRAAAQVMGCLLLIVCGLMLLITVIVMITGVRAAEPKGGIPGVLLYAESQRQAPPSPQKGEVKTAGPVRPALTDNAELKRRLTLREQTLRQLKAENRTLREKLKSLPEVKTDTGAKDKQIAGLTAELALVRAENRKRQDSLIREAEQAQGALDEQIIALKQQLARAEADRISGDKQAEKENILLTASLSALKADMAVMPVVTPATLTATAMQQVYATGVMMGRDILTLQAGQTLLGLTQDSRVLVAGIRDALNQKVQLNEPALQTALTQAEAAVQKARQTVIGVQKKAGAVYVEKYRKRKGVKKADGGFWYRLEYGGDGPLISGEDTLVDVVVTETLTDGTVVEDMDARGQVISQALGDYPLLFRAALALMKNHAMIELVVPPELAYGDEGYLPKVPPGATLRYAMRVENVRPIPDIVLPEPAGTDTNTVPGTKKKTAEGVKK